MRSTYATMVLLVPAANAWAHVAEMPLSRHLLEHGWLALALLSLLLLLRPTWRRRR